MPKVNNSNETFLSQFKQRKSEACGQTVLPDRSLSIGQKLVKMPKFKCDILSNFQTLWIVRDITIYISRGADVNAKDYKGCTPLRLARRYGQDEIERILSQKGAKDEQDPPSRKTSIGPDPPWMSSSRKSSAVTATAPPTRREGLSIGAN